MSLNVQQDMFNAETTWFHLFRTMFTNGDIRTIGPYAFTIYCAIKAHASFHTGEAFPGVDKLVELTGISAAQVKRVLTVLETAGYLSIEKKGRKNYYTLREKVAIQDAHGRPAAVATWDYLPKSVQDAMADLRNVLVTGDFAGAKIVQIQHLTVNVNSGSGTQINVDMSKSDAATKDEIKQIIAQAVRQGGSVNVTEDEEQF